jgi:hypothetical protein
MALITAMSADTAARTSRPERSAERPARSPLSGVSWGAILAGAAGAAALLLILGTGLGLSAVSPWAQEGIGVQSFTVSTILWVTATQLLAAGLGGYLAGRLRGQWLDVRTDEVYFRDTAHGFLAWAIATLASAALLSATIAAIAGSGVQAGASLAKAGADIAPTSYVVDSLFRQPANATGSVSTADREAARAEVTGIFMNTLRTGALPPEDQRYLGQLVAQRAGVSEAEANQRVSEGYGRAQAALRSAETAAREAADKARKASAYASLWLFIALLSGAFIASWAATFGGRRRDL